MDTRQIRTLEDPSTASPAELEEALAHWDELDAPSLARLDAHPEHGLRLRILRASERWLSDAAPKESDAAGPCPPAEVLYEHGRGPGAEGSPRDPEVTLHLERCIACSALVTSLESAPPLPLEWTSLSAEELEDADDEPQMPAIAAARHDGRAKAPSPSAAEGTRRVSPWFARYFPLAAAAALLLGVFLGPRLLSSSPLSQLPSPALLRGAENAALLFPRGPVLAGRDGSAAPSFEVSPVEGASEYRFELLSHEGGAFDEGRALANVRSATPRHEGLRLDSGSYTWRAFATVDGLERALGALDFEVRSDPALAADAAPEGVAALVERILALHEAGYLTDARVLARRLPDGPEKAAYLAPPGR